MRRDSARKFDQARRSAAVLAEGSSPSTYTETPCPHAQSIMNTDLGVAPKGTTDQRDAIAVVGTGER